MSVEVIEEALALICGKYIFPDKAVAAADAIRMRRDAGQYEGLTEPELAERLNTELFELFADKHLRFHVSDTEMQAVMTEADVVSFWREESRLENYGIAKVERLDGNIGYLDIRHLPYASDGGDAIAAAMALVSHTYALIIDLRKNTGGEPDGVTFWNSYLFPDDKTHLNDVYDGASGQTRQYWSLAHVPGQRYLGRPVYVLIGEKTFSAGETFCYNLKAQGRATLIGQTTRGGAHPVGVFPLTPTLIITVPNARSVNPVTGTNWEGVGVEPDLKVPTEEAFSVAYRKALEHALTTAASASVLAEIRAALAEQGTE
ncbi:MAG TPA: S41 family peptidase [Candidatus Limnocylindrales bacterium]|nr:S41 family peptidase [Candidatus Limnocylindrales bacterium]